MAGDGSSFFFLAPFFLTTFFLLPFLVDATFFSFVLLFVVFSLYLMEDFDFRFLVVGVYHMQRHINLHRETLRKEHCPIVDGAYLPYHPVDNAWLITPITLFRARERRVEGE